MSSSSSSSFPSSPHTTFYEYELPSTGAIALSEICTDMSVDKVYGRHIAEAGESRAAVRGVLKDVRRSGGSSGSGGGGAGGGGGGGGGGKDYLRVVKVLDDYIPRLRALIECVAHDEIALQTEPLFSWRTTLTPTLLSTSPRTSLPSLHFEYTSALLSYAYALSNLAWTSVSALGAYEHDPAQSDAARVAKDENITHAVGFLCRASGVFDAIAEEVLGEWAGSRTGGGMKGLSLPVEYTKGVGRALAKMALADAQTLAIRKLLSRASSDRASSSFSFTSSPSSLLPKSHPSPALLAKLHFECTAMYGAARGLVKSADGDVKAELRKYLGEREREHKVAGLMWLGVDAGEAGRGGEAVGFLVWAKADAASSSSSGKFSSSAKALSAKSLSSSAKSHFKSPSSPSAEIETFLKHYTKANDTVHFQPVPSKAHLQTRVPAGRLAVAVKPYVVPPGKLPFGPGSAEFERRRRGVEGDGDGDGDGSGVGDARGGGGGGGEAGRGKAKGEEVGQYAGAGAYF